MPQDNAPLLVAITGNIGTGKSSFCTFIEEEGYPMHSADRLAKAHLNDPDVKDALTQRYGDELYSNGVLDRGKLAESVFGKAAEIAFLNRLIHPKVLKDFADILDSSSNAIIFFEVPLLFEAKLSTCFDYTVLVKASHDAIFSRIKERDQMSTAGIEARLQAQIPDDEKEGWVDICILNDGSLEQLREKALWLVKHIEILPSRKRQSFNSVLSSFNPHGDIS